MFGIAYLFLFMVFFKYAVERYDYLPCVGIYAVGRGLIPALLALNGPVYAVILTVIYLIIGFLFVKAFTIFTENIENYWAIL